MLYPIVFCWFCITKLTIFLHQANPALNNPFTQELVTDEASNNLLSNLFGGLTTNEADEFDGAATDPDFNKLPYEELKRPSSRADSNVRSVTNARTAQYEEPERPSNRVRRHTAGGIANVVRDTTGGTGRGNTGGLSRGGRSSHAQFPGDASKPDDRVMSSVLNSFLEENILHNMGNTLGSIDESRFNWKGGHNAGYPTLSVYVWKLSQLFLFGSIRDFQFIK